MKRIIALKKPVRCRYHLFSHLEFQKIVGGCMFISAKIPFSFGAMKVSAGNFESKCVQRCPE